MALTVEGVAKDLGVAVGTVYKEVNKGNLKAFRVGRSIRIEEAALEEYKNRNSVQKMEVL